MTDSTWDEREVVSISPRTTISDVVAIADGARVTLSEEARAAIARSKAFADEVAACRPLYGRTTGVGANRMTPVAGADAHGVALVRSHATDAGESLPSRTVRATAATRLVQLSRARSGIDPAIPEALVRMLNADAMPEVGRLGSIGTGDLAALSALALAMAGERATSAAMPEPLVTWGADSALPFLSSNAATIARGLLAVDALARLDRASRALYALAVVGLDGNPEAFSPSAAATIGASGASDVCAEVRWHLDGHGAPAARIQDPYGLRIYPVTQATLVTSLRRLRDEVGRLLAAGQENPAFDADAGSVIHHGAFFQAQLAAELDATTLAIAQAATNAHARIRLANEPAYTGLRAFLAGGPPAASGLMMLEYTAASALAEVRASAAPTALGTISLSRGTEEDAGFATQGVVQLERAVEAYRTILACEMLSATRLVSQRGVIVPHRLARVARSMDAAMPHHEDQDLRPPLLAAAALLDEWAS